MSEHKLEAGVALRDINPEKGVQLGGYPYFDRANTGVHDPIVAAALFLRTNDAEVLLIATDLFKVQRDQGDYVRQRIAEATGIGPEHILLTGSHTHSAPWTDVVFKGYPGRPFDTEVSQEYLDYACNQCVKAGIRAMQDVFPAELGLGLATCGAAQGIGGNRLDPVNGPHDEDVPVLAVRDEHGTIRAVWTKYALHPTILHGENTLVSADFPGAMRSTVAEALPDAVFLYSMGTAGDQSPRYFREGQTFEEVERFGRTLGKAVLKALDGIEWLTEPRIALAHQAVDLVLKTYPDPEQLAQRAASLKQRHADLVASGAPYTEVQTADVWVLGAECNYQNALDERSGKLQKRYEAGAPYEVFALTVDDTGWAFLPGEIFSEFGLDIKRHSPMARTHVITMTNGHLPGYCVTKEALEEGGYESGNSILDPATGEVFVDTAVALFTTIKEA